VARRLASSSARRRAARAGEVREGEGKRKKRKGKKKKGKKRTGEKGRERGAAPAGFAVTVASVGLGTWRGAREGGLRRQDSRRRSRARG
jgi:hypothetical protein